jgi:peptidoglycan/LPS O-acetylase OafA/YrhL
MAASTEQPRLTSIDGLRGVAILLVMGYHYFYYDASPVHPGSNLFPFGSTFGWIPIFQYGYMGVYLFFIVSGFVIAMTLEKCATPWEFAVRRFARIWPTLAVCSVVTYTVVVFSGSPFSIQNEQTLANFLPSLTLTPNIVWSGAFPKADLIDGVYWTLLAEVRFYAMALAMYWLVSKNNLGRNLLIFTFVNILVRAALERLVPGSNKIYTGALIPDFLPWFVAGVVFYDLHERRIAAKTAVIYLALMYAVIVRTSTFGVSLGRIPLIESAGALLFFLIFWLVCSGSSLVDLFKARWLVFVGVCSYSIYLLHYSVGMVMISSISHQLNVYVQVSLTLMVAVFMVGAGYLSFLLVETPTRNVVSAALLPTRAGAVLEGGGG